MIFSLAAFPLLLFIGAAVDYAQLARSRVQLQRAVDAAVLAGVRAPREQRGAVALAWLRAAVATTAFSNVQSKWTDNADGTFSGLATASQRLSFATALGIDGANVSAAATAIAAGTVSATRLTR